MRLSFTILHCFFSFSLLAQEAYNCHFLLGNFNCTANNRKVCILIKDFCRDTVFELECPYLDTAFYNDIGIFSDRHGVLKYITNGMQLYNNQVKVLKNGSGINPGDFANDYFDGYNTVQSMFFLPVPGYENDQVELIHLKYEYLDPKLKNGGFAPYISSSRLDIFKDSIIYKNLSIKPGLYSPYGLTACKHANGRDWWIVQPLRNSNIIEIFLFDKTCINFHHSEILPFSLERFPAQAAFSPDGSKYCRNSQSPRGQDISVMDFDRCKGEFSNHAQWHFQDINGPSTWGVAVSPNSRFFYAGSINTIRQYDLWAADIQASEQIVARADTNRNDNKSFASMQLAPDGRIYIDEPRSSLRLAAVQKPDEPGLNCMIDQRFLRIPLYNQRNMPHFPNYALGPLKGSICDTLIVDNKFLPAANTDIEVMQSQGVIYLVNKNKIPIDEIKIYDLTGKLILHDLVDHQFSKLVLPSTLHTLSSYIYVLSYKHTFVTSGKIELY